MCPDLNSGAIVNARYANAPAKQKGGDLSNVECYTCHKMGHYSNKSPDRQPGTALGTRQEGKPWCSHHQANTHSTEECWHLHPHLKDRGGGHKKSKGKQQSNARSAETAGSGSLGTPSGARLQEMFQAFMLTQNAASASPPREDSYSGSVLELKVPLTPMSDSDQTQIRAGATPWKSPTLQARAAAATLTRKGPEGQRLAGPQSKMPLGFLQQGPLTARLRGGGEGSEKEPKIDAEAVSKGEGEPDETMPEPEEPAGTKPGLEVLPGTKNGSPGGRQTRSMTDALLRVDETELGKSKFSVVMPKGCGELPQTDPQYQGIQGFNFGDFPALGGGVSKDTTSNVTKGAKEAPAEDIGIVKPLKEEIEAGSRMTPDLKGKAKEPTDAVEGVSHIPTPIWPAEAPAAPAQQISRPSLFRGSRFSAEDMAEEEGSVKRRVTPKKGKKQTPLHDNPESDLSDDLKAKYLREGVSMVLGGPVTKNIRQRVKLVFESDYCKDVEPEQGLVNYIFRGVFT
jgi:hypothetical protein